MTFNDVHLKGAKYKKVQIQIKCIKRMAEAWIYAYFYKNMTKIEVQNFLI